MKTKYKIGLWAVVAVAGSLGGFTYQPSAAPTMLPCLQNPTTHYDATDHGVISGNPLTWIDKGNTKSIYDPCPYGYRVPINGSWEGFPSNKWTDGDIKGGALWRSTWWPATGYRYYTSAALATVAEGGYCWSSSPHPSIAYSSSNLYFNYSEYVDPSTSADRSYGLPLRCVQE